MSTAQAALRKGLTASQSQTLLGVALVGVLAIMVLPVPPLALDLLLAFSVTVSLLVFLVSLQVEKPIEFSIFPTLLLMMTLFRLSLNVASTRLILLNGDAGPDAAGSVIKSFGQFVVGGNYVVGLIVFIILVLINFIVITKGAGRIAEVAARFTLDAMPGKQMAIDAELSAGMINETDARKRRRLIEREADFHGSMDGASKFVRGDAIAGLLITMINLVGGIIVGVAYLKMTAAEAAGTFAILTVGDGLVAQIPALLVSTAAGMLTSRVATEGDLGSALGLQMFKSRQPAYIAAGLLGGLAIVPGMPHFAFLALAAALGFVAWRMPEKVDEEFEEGEEPASAAEAERAEIESLLSVDLLEIQLGYELIPLVDQNAGGELLTRIGAIRRQFAQDLGIMVPAIHVRDNLRLKPSEYRVMMSGNEIGGGSLRIGRFLAMNPLGGEFEIPGEQTKEPAFGLPALWIGPGDRDTAELNGYTVVDPPSVVATHLTELLRGCASELLGRAELQELLDVFGRTNPKLVEELIPTQLPLGDVLKVLKRLLAENVSIRDLRSILEALADNAAVTKDPGELCELVRERLAKGLTMQFKSDDGAVYGLVLDPQIEAMFRQSQRPATDGGGMDPQTIPALLDAFSTALRDLQQSQHAPLLICAPDIRRTLAAFAARHAGGMPVIGYREIEPQTPVRTVGVVRPKARSKA